MKTDDVRETARRRAGELADGARGAAKELMSGAKRAAYAVVGAPVVVGRRLAHYGEKMGEGFRHEIETAIDEGERLAERLRDRKVVEELREKVDIDQLQGRVERLRDQLEDVLANWRENFLPHREAEEPPASKPDSSTAKKGATRSTAKKADTEST